MGYQLHLKGKNAEDFVYELSKKSFLEDWCYQSPRLPNSKEICDLLIVYDDIAIIWQVKDLKLDNNKYNKSEVKRNLKQLSTARNRLFKLRIPIKLENRRGGKKDFNFREIKRVYLISALLGKGEDYFSFVEMLGKDIVHTFTREFTEIILKELDTIKDFTDYLEEKEQLIRIGSEINILGGEQELLAYYLGNMRTFEKLKKVHSLVITDGCWEDFQRKPEYSKKKEEDSISYGWDDIINRSHECGGEYEKIARELARTNRFERRLLSKSFFEALVLANNKQKNNTFRRVLALNGVTYCFVFMDDVEPRIRRQNLLRAICFIARGMHKENKKVIGIATEMKIRSGCSYDFYLLEIPNWTEKEQTSMEKLQKETRIFLNVEPKYIHESEYTDGHQ